MHVFMAGANNSGRRKSHALTMHVCSMQKFVPQKEIFNIHTVTALFLNAQK